ncbi:MAG: Rieske 2Fe-2S domain-containing protein [Burkholderiaceae bacterium]
MNDSPTSPIPVCASDALVDGGDGIRFRVMTRDGPGIGFVVRFQGQPRAYLNRCAHEGIELDWEHGKFFDRSGLYLFCSTHGAVYAPDSGRCTGGPCRGRGLRAIAVEERGATIWWTPDTHFTAPGPEEPCPGIPSL